jgi:hypothetical protein
MAGFEIDGEVYEVPRLDTFDMDEAQILYDLSGIVLEDFIPPHPDDSEEEREALLTLQMARVRNPAFRRALVVIAYVRANPDAVPAEVSQRVGKINAVDVTLAVLTRKGDDEEDPSTSSPKLPEEKSSENETLPPSSSGSHSGSVSAARVVNLLPTGASESDTSSPASPEMVSAS